MKNIVIALSGIVLLSACNKAPTDAASTETSNTATAVAAAMPAECQTYVNNVKDMVSKTLKQRKHLKQV